jgi:glycosyltransferase involved in cell wall biosynthesis
MLTESFRLGGKERRITELLKKIELLDNIVCEVVILKNLIEYPDIYDLEKVKIRVISRRIKKDPTVFYKVYRIIKAFRPDIIHSWGPMPSMYVFPISRLLGIKLINNMVSNGYVKAFSKTWFRAKISFPFSDIIISNSKAGLSAYNVSSKMGRVIYNGFDFDRLENLEDIQATRAKYNVVGTFVVGMVAVFNKRKDFATFFSAAKKILLQYDDICFIAAGDGPDLEYYRNQIGSAFKDRIILPGLVHNIESLINLFDIGVLTTNTKLHQEGISNSILEYMASGKPVIATRGGGSCEIIRDKENGLLIEPFSENELIENIICLHNNPLKRNELGINAKNTVINYFSIEKMLENYLQLYDSLISRQNGLS